MRTAIHKSTLRRAVQDFCAACMGGPKQVHLCETQICELKAAREAKPPLPKREVFNLIRRYCYNCVGGEGMAQCTERGKCAFWPYRLGRAPAFRNAKEREQQYVLPGVGEIPAKIVTDPVLDIKSGAAST